MTFLVVFGSGRFDCRIRIRNTAYRYLKEIYIEFTLSRYMHRPVMSGPGLYDPTSIMNADTLNKCQREGWVKLAFYLLAFFYYLYGYVRNHTTLKKY